MWFASASAQPATAGRRRDPGKGAERAEHELETALQAPVGDLDLEAVLERLDHLDEFDESTSRSAHVLSGRRPARPAP
jgi:hypothetical protein